MQPDEAAHEVTEHEGWLTRLGVDTDDRVLSDELELFELLAVGPFLDVDATDALLAALAGVVVAIGMHGAQAFGERLQRRRKRLVGTHRIGPDGGPAVRWQRHRTQHADRWYAVDERDVGVPTVGFALLGID